MFITADLQTAARALGGEVVNGQISCPGPGHTRQDRSLSVKFDGDKLLIHSFCDDDFQLCDDYVRNALGLEKWNPNGKVEKPQTRPTEIDPWQWKTLVPVPSDAPPITDELCQQFAPLGHRFRTYWPYLDKNGQLIGAVCRYDNTELPDEKQFRPLTFCEAKGCREWRSKTFQEPRPIFGLQLLAVRPEASVLLVEGEKTAVKARLLLPDYLTITSSGGAQSARKTDWTPLKDRHVVIWPDADEAGANYAIKAAQEIARAGAVEIRIVDVSGLPEGWDLADEVPDGVDLARLLAEAAPPRADEIKGDADSKSRPDSKPHLSDKEIKEEIQRLSLLSVVLYEHERSAAAAKLKIRASILDILVKERRLEGKAPGERETASGSDAIFEDVEPWAEPVDGALLLDEIAAVIAKHIVLPTGAADAIALWVAHAHAHDMATVSPILAPTSPVHECGKSSLLTLLSKLVPRPLPSSNVTAAVLFRAVEKWHPCLIVDEADTYLTTSEELRGVINSGHNRAMAWVLRACGDDFEPRKFSTWAPKVIAMIGRLPVTTASRAIHIPLQRMAPTDKVEPVASDKLGYLLPLHRRLIRFIADNEVTLRAASPDIPKTLTGRRADNWRALLAIADVAGGHWPQKARAAAEALSAPDSSTAAGIMLLSDIRDIFAEDNASRISSKDLATTLGGMLDRPWPEWKNGKPITDRQIAALLGPFGIHSRSVRHGGDTFKGYLREQFEDVFSRYLAPIPQHTPSPAVTPTQSLEFNGLASLRSVTLSRGVTDQNSSKPLNSNDCDGVTDVDSPNGVKAHDEGYSVSQQGPGPEPDKPAKGRFRTVL